MTRAEIAKATLENIAAGGYMLPAGTRVPLREAVDAAVAGTKLYRLGDAARPVATAPGATSRATAIIVTAETTVEAIVRLERGGGGHLAALNFASARNPGGGFLGGAQAQEEALARSSALYPCLCTQNASYYEPNRANKALLYLDLAIFSPGVPFFRYDSGDLLERPALCSVITAPAPNAGAVRNNQPDLLSQVLPTLRRRAEMVLAIAAAEKVERLILGAWGCGVFRNDPAEVAGVFGELLKDGGAFAGVFGEVVFAIYDRTPEREVLEAFRGVFGGGEAQRPII